MKKRILQLTGSFHNGGSERQAAALAAGLKHEGKYDVILAALNRKGVLLAEVEAAGFEVPEFPLASFFDANFFRQLRRCVKYLRDERIDLIHTHDFYTNVFGMAAATLAGTRARVASKRETGGMRTGGQLFVEKIAFRKSHKIVANSEAVRDSLVSNGLPLGKIEVIYNGVDLDRYASAADPTLQSRPRRITLVANLRHEVKNVPMFLNTAGIVARDHPDVRFVIAGEGELRPGLETLASELGVEESVEFLGRCDDVPALLADSYACVLTSMAEGFSNSIVEYMAAAKPVVATRVGGAAEAVVQGESGYLVESGDAEAMAAALIDLLNDPAKASRFGKAGREAVEEKFSREAQLDATSALYDSLLG